MKAYFLSDLHLKSMDEPNAKRFLAFLKNLHQDADLTHLFLVGDIFDLWIAHHDYFIEKFSPLVAELKRLHEKGIEIHYFEGNHDLYLTKWWRNQLGFHVHQNAMDTQLGDFHVRVEHGDEIDREDHGYLFLRGFLRTSLMVWLAHSLPSALVAWIGGRASHASRAYTSETKTITSTHAVQKIRAHAQALADNRPLDFVVTGHLHVRDDVVLNRGQHSVRSVNLGTWLEQPVAFLLSDTEQMFVEV